MIKIITACVNPEMGEYVAIAVDRDEVQKEFSRTSPAEAVGLLVTRNPDFFDCEVTHIEREEKPIRPARDEQKGNGS